MRARRRTSSIRSAPVASGGAPAQDLLQILEAAVRLVEAIEGRQRLGVVGHLGQDRLVGLGGALGQRQLLLVDRRHLEPQRARALPVGDELRLLLQALDHLRPQADARVQPRERRVRVEDLVDLGRERRRRRRLVLRSSSASSSSRSSVSIAS